jgi:hypothetical protein
MHDFTLASYLLHSSSRGIWVSATASDCSRLVTLHVREWSRHCQSKTYDLSDAEEKRKQAWATKDERTNDKERSAEQTQKAPPK